MASRMAKNHAGIFLEPFELYRHHVDSFSNRYQRFCRQYGVQQADETARAPVAKEQKLSVDYREASSAEIAK